LDALDPPPEELWKSPHAEQAQRLAELRDLMSRLDAVPVLSHIASLHETALPLLETILENSDADEKRAVEWLRRLHEAFAISSRNAADRVASWSGWQLNAPSWWRSIFRFCSTRRETCRHRLQRRDATS